MIIISIDIIKWIGTTTWCLLLSVTNCTTKLFIESCQYYTDWDVDVKQIIFPSALIILVLYYLFYVAKKPLLICAKDDKFGHFLLEHCPSIQERYWPPIWCFETHFHTPFAIKLRGLLPELPYKREYIVTPDGGQISLDWLIWNQANKYNDDGDETKFNQQRPIALFMPGITGHSQSEYLRSLIPLVANAGYRVVSMNHRGLGGTPLLTPRFYCAANDEDFRTALAHIRATNGGNQCRLIAIGISMGAMILAKYLVDTGDDAAVDGACLLSICWDFGQVMSSMKRGLNYLLNRHITQTMIRFVLHNQKLFEHCPKYDIDRISRCRDINEFDEAFTIRMFNFDSIHHYYSECRHLGKLAKIKRPTLCINAADDMFAPLTSLPIDEIRQSETGNVALVVTARGGHIGFMEGMLWPYMNGHHYSDRLIEQYVRALHQWPTSSSTLIPPLPCDEL